MKIFLILLFSVSMLLASTDAIKSVVKIYTSVSISNYQMPWQISKIENWTGSGVIIQNNKILTSAHVVSNANFIEITKENDSNKYIAKVKYISHQADLALLEVEDETFFNNTQILKLSDDIEVRDKVTVLGYPVGGNSVSITQGVVSRIEYRKYVWSNLNLLAIQIDAAINNGNSGGAVINSNNQLVGIAMQTLTKGSNIGYIVPTAIINTFLEDTKDGNINGFQNEINYVKILNNDMKEFYGLTNNKGVLLSQITFGENQLNANDIILNIDGNDVANDGTISSKYGKIDFKLALHLKQIDQSIKLKILRNKQEITIDYKIKRLQNLIYAEYEKKPRYIIYGGLVFSPITQNYLSKVAEIKDLEMFFYNFDKNENLEEAVVLLQDSFPHNVNKGYKSEILVLNFVNGIKIKNFNHLIELLDNTNSEFIKFEFLEDQIIILNTKEAKKSFEDIKKTYSLNYDRKL